MKISSQSTGRKKVIIVAIISCALLLTGVAAAYHYHVGPFSSSATSSVDLNPATDEQKKSGTTSKQQSIESSDNKQGVTGSDQPPAPAAQPDGSKSKVETIITAANQNGATLQIRSLISTVTNDGTCTLALTNSSSQQIVKTSGVQALSTSSTCKGFDIPTSDLSIGEWQAVISYESNTLTGTTSSKSIDIKAQ